MKRIRLYHATLAILAFLAYLTGELGLVHAWLGYGVAAVIVMRLLWALNGDYQLGLMRFYPSFTGLKLYNITAHPAISKAFMFGIAVSLVMVTATGIAIDKGQSIGVSNIEVVMPAYVDDDSKIRQQHKQEGYLEESHELFANMLALFVGLHVTYLLLFKRPLAQFMLFAPKKELQQIKGKKIEN